MLLIGFCPLQFRLFLELTRWQLCLEHLPVSYLRYRSLGSVHIRVRLNKPSMPT